VGTLGRTWWHRECHPSSASGRLGEPSIYRRVSAKAVDRHVTRAGNIPVLSSGGCSEWDSQKDRIATGIGKAFYDAVVERRHCFRDSSPAGLVRERVSGCESGVTNDANKRETL
jgi:hypothetical protein